MASKSKRKVDYFHDGESVGTLENGGLTTGHVADVGAYTYGLGHPMKPHRIQVAHELVTAYDMLPKMQVLVRYVSSSSALANINPACKEGIGRGNDKISHRRIRSLPTQSDA